MSDLAATFDVIRKTRASLAAIVGAIPDDARTVIPDGFNNHILWNVGHVVATEQLLTYGLSGASPNLSDAFLGAFRKGTTPKDWDREWTWDEIREPLMSLPSQTEADIAAGRFDTFRPYTTTPGVVLASVADAVRFNLYHEGLHLGSVLALRRAISS